MAKVSGPCMSTEAHGTIGNCLTFQQRGRGFAAIRPPVPRKSKTSNPTAGQTTQRLKIKALVESWQAFTDEQKAAWNAEAKISGDNLSGYHHFIKNGEATPLTTISVLGHYTGSDPQKINFLLGTGLLA